LEKEIPIESKWLMWPIWLY